MKLYLDTCIANDAWVVFQAHAAEKMQPKDVKRPLKSNRLLETKRRRKRIRPYEGFIYEYVALYYLLDLDDQWGLEFGSSLIMRQEIDNKWRDKSVRAGEKKNFLNVVYDLLVEKVPPQKLIPVPQTLFRQVASVLPDRKDVEHVCQAALGLWDFFVTTDFRSVLDNAGRLEALGIHAISPRSFVEGNFLTLDQLVRTLHGSWVSLDSVVEDWISSIEEAKA